MTPGVGSCLGACGKSDELYEGGEKEDPELVGLLNPEAEVVEVFPSRAPDAFLLAAPMVFCA